MNEEEPEEEGRDPSKLFEMPAIGEVPGRKILVKKNQKKSGNNVRQVKFQATTEETEPEKTDDCQESLKLQGETYNFG